MKKEKTLVFQYADSGKFIQELKNALTADNIDFVHYDDGIRQLFKINKSNKTWISIMLLINSIRPAKYNYENTCILNGVETEII